MTEQQVPVVRTPVSMRDYARACIRAWRGLGDGPTPCKQAVAVLWAQYMIETGGKACWNWNIGNVKHVAGDGFDYMCLSGVWEGVTKIAADALVASGQAVMDPSGDHARAVGAGHVSVIFRPPHPATWFRAFQSLDEAMLEHLELLAKRRFSSAWPAVVSGNLEAFVAALKDRGYFTAAPSAYIAGMRRPFGEFLTSDVFNVEMDAYLRALDAETLPELPNPPSEPTRVTSAADMPTILPQPAELIEGAIAEYRKERDEEG